MPVSAVWFDFEDTRHGVITLDDVALLGEANLDGIVLAHAWELNDKPMISYVFVGGAPDLPKLYEAHGEMEVGYDEKLLLADIERELRNIPYRRPALRRSCLVRGGMMSIPPGFDPDAYPSREAAEAAHFDLLKLLDEAGLGKFRARFNEEILSILSRFGEPDREYYEWLSAAGKAGAHRREFASYFPMLVPTILQSSVAPDCHQAIDRGHSILPSLNRLLQGEFPQDDGAELTSGHLQALRRADWGVERDISNFQVMLPRIAPNKVPLTQDDARACERLSNLWMAARQAFGPPRCQNRPLKPLETLLRGIDKNWSASLAQLEAEFGRPRLERIDPSWFSDPSLHFFSRVLSPAVRHATGMSCVDDETTYDLVNALSFSLVYRDLNIAGMLRQSERWHSAFRRLALASQPDLSWDRLFDSYVCPNTGLQLTCLGSSRELFHEGSAGLDEEGFAGLAHCVATYVPRCARYDCAIISIRERLQDGSPGARLSTAELVRDEGGNLSCLQHAGFDNSAPRDRAVAALASYMEAIGTGAVRGASERLGIQGHNHPLDPHHPLAEAADPAERETNWEFWRPMLARGFRKMTADDFAMWLATQLNLRRRVAA